MLSKVVGLEVEGIRITGQLYLPSGRGSFPTVCVCHGIPAHIPDPNDSGYPLLAERICRQELAVFIFNFRGTGASGGNLDILGWTRDLKAVLDYLCALPELDRSHLSLLGFSGGAAVSVYVAAHDKRVSSIVTCACPAEFTLLTKAGDSQAVIDRFRSIGAIRDDSFPASVADWFRGFETVSPIKYIAEIAPRPLLLVHGDQDETVAVSHAHRLYARAEEPKQLKIVEGAGHRLRQDDRIVTIVTDWLKSKDL